MCVVEHLGEGIVGSVGPDRVKVRVGPSPKQQGTGLGHAFAGRAGQDRIGVGRRPSPVLEASTEILVAPSRRLHDSIERQILEHNDFAHIHQATEAARRQ